MIATKEFVESLGWKCITIGTEPYWMYNFGFISDNEDFRKCEEDDYHYDMTIWGLGQKNNYRIEISDEEGYLYQSQKDISLTEEKLKQILEDVID
jgi:hypothetical protein